ncbi:MAG: hypothetical protein COC15_02675 [Legionellales bacterium]|nr:MAG: hypothetical protein COC15_02675 [Legionellales bacterium]
MVIGCDVYIEKNIDSKILNNMFVEIFKQPKSNFYLIEGFIGDYIDENGNFTLDYAAHDKRHLCQRYDETGDFKTKIDLAIETNTLWSSELDVAKMIAKYLDCKCLIGSEEINPYHWIVINANGTHKPVFVDVDRLDKHHEFVIECDA